MTPFRMRRATAIHLVSEPPRPIRPVAVADLSGPAFHLNRCGRPELTVRRRDFAGRPMVTDPFIPAVEELAQALSAGDDLEPALEEIAQEHGLAPQALRNRAIRALGPLETYRERHAATVKERHRANMRSDPVLAAATFLAEVSNLDPKLSAAEREASIERL